LATYDDFKYVLAYRQFIVGSETPNYLKLAPDRIEQTVVAAVTASTFASANASAFLYRF
jgi:hypothetical protein